MRASLLPVFAALAFATVASAGEINLAKPPQDAHGNEPASTVTPKPVILINKASEADLIRLEDIGPLHARQVIANRPYDGPEDFRRRSGLPAERFDKVKDLLDF